VKPASLWRTLAALAAVVVLLAGLDTYLRQRRAAERALTAVLRPLVDPARDVVPERVRRLRLQAAGARAARAPARAWVYEWDGRAWRLPDLHGAYAAPENVDFLLRGLLQSLGTVVATDPGVVARYGLQTDRAPRVVLEGGSGQVLLDVLLGRAAPDQRGAEAYVRRAGSDTVLHLHANPARALAGNPPLLDTRVLPRALARRALVEVTFRGPAAGDLVRLRRVDVPADPAAPGPPLPGAAHAWVLTHAGRQDTCEAASAGAYLAYLARLQAVAVLPPNGDYAFAAGSRLTLVDEEGTADRLDVGGRVDGDRGYLRHTGAGVTFAVEAGALDLLFPAPRLLLEPLPEPSPFAAR